MPRPRGVSTGVGSTASQIRNRTDKISLRRLARRTDLRTEGACDGSAHIGANGTAQRITMRHGGCLWAARCADPPSIQKPNETIHRGQALGQFSHADLSGTNVVPGFFEWTLARRPRSR